MDGLATRSAHLRPLYDVIHGAEDAPFAPASAGDVLGPWRLMTQLLAHDDDCVLWVAELAAAPPPGVSTPRHVLLKLKAYLAHGDEADNNACERSSQRVKGDRELSFMQARMLHTVPLYYSYGLAPAYSWTAMRRFSCSLRALAVAVATEGARGPTAAWFGAHWQYVALGIAASLKPVHLRGWVHGDLKQANLVVFRGDDAWLDAPEPASGSACDFARAEPASGHGVLGHATSNLYWMAYCGGRTSARVPPWIEDVSAVVWNLAMALHGIPNGAEPSRLNLWARMECMRDAQPHLSNAQLLDLLDDTVCSWLWRSREMPHTPQLRNCIRFLVRAEARGNKMGTEPTEAEYGEWVDALERDLKFKAL